MNAQPGEVAAVGAGVAYLAALSWAMVSFSYDIWGALVVVPVYGVLGAAIIRRLFRGPLTPVATALYWGLLIKLGGVAGRYWVGFEAYDGDIDAGRYHAFAIDAAGRVWSGEDSFLGLFPTQVGTVFVDEFTAVVYTLTGGSQLAGFVTFSFFAFVGIIFFVKAAILAVPGLAARRYAWMCVLFPSIVYWPSSIGKEALMLFGLGLGAYGIAALLTYGRWFSSLVIIGLGLGFTALIRPHIAGIWVAATVPALVIAFVRRARVSGSPSGRRGGSKLGLIVVLVIAMAGLSLIATATIQYLSPSSDDETSTGNSLTLILEETTRRTSQAGSNFTPPSVSNPMNWPYAVARTLTRPLPFEAQGVGQLVSAAEMTALLGIYVLSRKRLANLPRLIVSNPYVTFAVTALFLAGLAYTSLANLGVLTRQKSLVMPFLLLLPCLPARSGMTRTESHSRPDRRADPVSAVASTTPNGALAPSTGALSRSTAGLAQPRGADTTGDAPTHHAGSSTDEIWT